MKPAVCAVCGAAASADKSGGEGGWVEFADFVADERDALSHPAGLEYFCARHLPAAERKKNLNAQTAIAELRREFMTESVRDKSGDQESLPAPWWRRWFS